MKSFKNYISFLILLTAMFSFMSCEDDNNNQQDEDVFAGCCSEDPAFGTNIDNLDQSEGGVISVSSIVTPNNDAINDFFGISNIENYSNHMVAIFNADDELVFETTNYTGSFGNTGNLFPNGEQTEFGITTYPDGTYKYIIIIEDEQTFYKSGYFCLYSGNPPIPLEEQNFSECLEAGEFDPIVVG
jgi:hypothetical protein